MPDTVPSQIETERESLPLLSERRGPVLQLTLNRPDRLNAVSYRTYRLLAAALRQAERDPGLRAVVLTGEGRAFCAGADLKSHAGADPTRAQRLRYILSGQRTSRRIREARLPVIAAVNGHAIGAGLELALACDFLLVAEDARLRFPEAALGTFVGGGATITLAERVGAQRARELLLLGDFFTGRDAADMGLANRALPADRVLSAAHELAEQLAARAPLSIKHLKQALAAGQPDLRQALRREAAALAQCMASEDWKEGIRSYHEQRTPRYRGR